MRASQYLMLGEDPPGVRLELVDGQIAIGPSNTPGHSFVDIRLSAILLRHIQENDLGELIGNTDVVFGGYDVRRPDIIWIRKDHVHLIEADEAINFPPDLCIEIVSNASAEFDRKDKFKQYAAARVRYYWIIDPQTERIEAYRLVRRNYEVTALARGNVKIPLLPFLHLEIPWGEIWFSAKRK